MGYLPHLITFILLIGVVVFAFINIFHVHRAHKSPLLQRLLYFMCLFQILTMASFAANQVGWIINDYEVFVGLDVQLGWLAYDYQNKLFHLTAAGVLNHYLRFKHTNPREAHRRRGSDD